MKKQITILLFGLTLLLNQATAQTFKQQFNDLVSKGDTIGQIHLIEKWEKANNNDPELYVAGFNYYVQKSRKEMIRMDNNPKGKDVLKIMDKDSTNKKPVAFLYGDTYYDDNLLKKGFDYIDIGIKKFPNRLDMRFGKIYMYGKIEDYEKFTTEIIKTIDYSQEINNKWTWTDDKPQDNPKDFMLGAIQDYQVQLYNTEKDNLLDNMKQIAEAVLKYYPNHVESLSNLSIVLMLKKQYDKALEPLLKAEQINPKDYIVLSNIAQAYKLKRDYKNSIKYYELTKETDDQELKKYAESQIFELKKK